MQLRTKRALLATSLGGAASLSAFAQSLPNTAIAVSGLPAPGRPAGVVFANINTSYAIRGSTVAFQADTTENGDHRLGAWLLKDNVLSQPVYEGEPIANVSNMVISGATNIEPDSSGDIAFFQQSGLFEWKGGSVFRIAAENMAIPGASSGTIGPISRPSLNETGKIAFRADSGLYTDAFGGNLERIASYGQTAADGGTYQSFDLVVISGNRITTTGQSTIFGLNCTAVYSFTPNSNELVAATRNPAPLLPDYILESFNRIYTNGSGHLTFSAYLINAANPGDQFRILYSENSTGMHTLIKTGQPAPGVPDMTLSEIGNSVSSNNDRVLAFTFLNDGRRALFASDTVGTMHLVTLTGQTAPDLPNGITFGQDYSYYAIGDTGTVGFIVDLNDPTGTLSGHRAFFASNPAGVTHLVAYIGETIKAGPGLPNWTISDIQFADDFANPLPDSSISGDQLLYRLSFAGGRTGLYTTVVPESVNPFTAASGSWNTSANWTYGTPDSSGAIAQFPALASASTILLDGDKRVASLIFDSPASYTLNPGTGGTLTFANYGNSTMLQAKQGQHTIAVPLKFIDSGSLDISAGAQLTSTAGVLIAAGKTLTKIGAGTMQITGGLSQDAGATTDVTAGELRIDRITGHGSLKIRTGAVARLTAVGQASSVSGLSIDGQPGAWTGTLDIGQAGLVIDYSVGASPLLSVTDQIKSARMSGWNGPGIGSSAAASDSKTAVAVAEASSLLHLKLEETATFMGETVDANSLLIRFTKLGDATMDGTVDFADLVKVAQNYGEAVGLDGWDRGDFNYDGQVDFQDLVAVAQNYGTSLPQADFASAFAVDAPEPGTVLPVAAIALNQFLRRRRNKSL